MNFCLSLLTYDMLSSAQRTLLKSGTANETSLDSASLFILRHGWAAATTRQYAAAVNKFLYFLHSTLSSEISQPFNAKTIYHFILWCSSTSKHVSSSTIKRYLTGLRMWHCLHGNTFPAVDPHQIRLLLKSCLKTEIPRLAKTRIGLTLRDVLTLSDRLTSLNNLDLVTKAILLVGFWGLARLGELTARPDNQEIFVRRKDVTFTPDGQKALIRLRDAKTAQPGEDQWLRLTAQPNRIDPINVLHEVLLRIPGSPNDPLFPGKIRNLPLSKSYVSRFLKSNGPQDGRQWSGHSLRIGGASFQFNAGRGVPSLKRLGRWKSSVYRTYIKKYSPGLSRETLLLSKVLHF